MMGVATQKAPLAPVLSRRAGFVLVTVLWVLAFLTVITLGFGYRAVLERRAATYTLDQAQAMMMARGAVNRGVVELRNKALEDFAQALRLYGVENMDRASSLTATHAGQPWAQPKDLYAEGYYERGEGYDEDVAEYRISDLAGRINIGSGLGAAKRKLLDNVEALKGGRRKLYARLMGREFDKQEYSTFHAIEELRYIDGIDNEDWYGDKEHAGLKDLLTTHGQEQININTASRDVLACVPGLEDNAIEAILTYRAGGDGALNSSDDRGFASLQHAIRYSKLQGEAAQALTTYCAVTSSCFRIRGVATRRQGAIVAVCTADVTIGGQGAAILSWQEGSFAS